MLIHCPSLTPIQSRLAASCLSLLFLAAVYYALSHTQFAYAAEIRDGSIAEQLELFPRAEALLIDGNNSPNRGNLSPGQSSTWHYPTTLLQGGFSNQSTTLPGNLTVARKAPTIAHIDLRKREEHGLEERQTSARTVYISINTCSQPIWSGPGPQQSAPPQLTLFVGQPGSQNVGAGGSGQTLDDGYASYSISSSTDVYVAVSAPTLPSGFTGNWAYDIAMSIDGYYHAVNFNSSFLYLVDSDVNSTLLVTDDLTKQPANSTVYQQWMGLQKLPFAVFANPDASGKRWGLESSVCGLQSVAEVNTLQNKTNGTFAITSMVARGLNKGPKQQFFLSNLTNTTTYSASLALVGNGVNSGKGVVGGGGTVWLPTTFTTKSNGNCHLLYDLKFCSDVAYAVPSNPRYDTAALGALYDDYASKLYKNFSYSLQQIQCNTSNDQRYTLARNCDDCAASYKEWLCAVTMPRCEDFTKNETWLYPKNVGQPFYQNGSMLSDEILSQQFQPMPGAPTLPGSPIQQTWLSSFATNQSRNPTIIDQVIKPGPYKEILPCEDVCYDLVQSCPASLQFGCPLPGRGLEANYGQRSPDRSIIKCNYLGAVYYLDDARQMVPSMLLALATTALSVLLSFT